jgi:hypothetical protein
MTDAIAKTYLIRLIIIIVKIKININDKVNTASSIPSTNIYTFIYVLLNK